MIIISLDYGQFFLEYAYWNFDSRISRLVYWAAVVVSPEYDLMGATVGHLLLVVFQYFGTPQSDASKVPVFHANSASTLRLSAHR